MCASHFLCDIHFICTWLEWLIHEHVNLLIPIRYGLRFLCIDSASLENPSIMSQLYRNVLLNWWIYKTSNCNTDAQLSTLSFKPHWQRDLHVGGKANITQSAIFLPTRVCLIAVFRETRGARWPCVKCLISGKWLQCQTSPSCHSAAIFRISMRSSCRGWNHILIPTTLLLWWGRSALRHI